MLGDCLCLLGRRLLLNLEIQGADEAFDEAEECYHRALSDPKPEIVLGAYFCELLFTDS